MGDSWDFAQNPHGARGVFYDPTYTNATRRSVHSALNDLVPRLLVRNLTPTYTYASDVLDYAIAFGEYDAGSDRHKFDITITPTQQFNFMRLQGTVRGNGTEIGKFSGIEMAVVVDDATAASGASTETVYGISGRLTTKIGQENKFLRGGVTDAGDGTNAPVCMFLSGDITLLSTSNGSSTWAQATIKNTGPSHANDKGSFLTALTSRSDGGTEARPRVKRGMFFQNMVFGEAVLEARISDDTTANADGGTTQAATPATADFIRLRHMTDEAAGTFSDLFMVDFNGHVTDGEWRATEVAVAYGGTGATTAIGATQNLGTWHVLAASGAAVVHTGTTAITTLATITVPANAMGPNGAVRVTALWSNSSAANSATHRTMFGGTSYGAHNLAAGQNTRLQKEILNRGVTNSQVGMQGASDGWGDTATALKTSAIDTTADVNITLTAQLTDAADTMTLEGYTVELFYGA